MISILALPAVIAAEDPAESGVKWSADVEGVVFSDDNRNKRFDKADLPGRGILIRLISLDAEEIEIARLRTDDTGRFTFPAIFAGNYRLEVIGFRKELTRSDSFEVSPGKATPFIAIEIDSALSGNFRGRIANPDSTKGDIVSPFSPDSTRRVSGPDQKNKQPSDS